MLRLEEQLRISEYERIYDNVIPEDNLLRKIKENIDGKAFGQMVIQLPED